MVERLTPLWTFQEFIPEEDGDYVRHSDYAALERQLAEARAETERLDRELNVSQMQETIGVERFQVAEAERDRLAADNARLREALRGAMSDQHDLLHTCREYAKAAPDEDIRAARSIRADRIEERLNATTAAITAGKE